MATIKFDSIATNFIKLIPTTFKSTFTPGGGAMPDSYALLAAQISDYVNRAMMKLFNDEWARLGGDTKAFTKVFPELQDISGAVSLDAGNYTIANPYLNFKKLIGCTKQDGNYIEIWPDYIYAYAKAGKYQYVATTDNPSIIQINNLLAIFPQSSSFSIIFQYIKLPLDKTTGNPLTQNGSNDSPFSYEWNERIAQIAYELYLQEHYDTA